MILQFFNRKKEQENGEEHELEEPNLYNLIEKLILEKQEMQNHMTKMEQKIGLLKEELKGLKERYPPHG